MSKFESLKILYDEFSKFHTNLGKDNNDRRKDSRTTERYLSKLEDLKTSVEEIRKEVNEKYLEPEAKEKFQLLIVKIERLQTDIFVTLENRLKLSNLVHHSNGSSSNNSSQITGIPTEISTMSENFDLKTATSLIPSMDGSENGTRRLIDAIELYESLLNDAGKQLLIRFVLKTKLTEAAKIRLNPDYQSVQGLLNDISKHLLSKKSASALSASLHSARQKHKSINEFGQEIEEMMLNLTISQADGDKNALKCLPQINEKLAITAFANGLRDPNLRTIIKARNYSSLKDAISGAKDEEISNRAGASEQVFQYSTRNKRSTRNFRGSRQFNQRGNYPPRAINNNSSNNRNNPTNSYHQNSRGRVNRGRGSNRGSRYFRNNYNQRSFFLETQGHSETPNASTATQENNDLFFRENRQN